MVDYAYSPTIGGSDASYASGLLTRATTKSAPEATLLTVRDGWGSFSSIVAAGRYIVRLHLVDYVSTAAAQRRMWLEVNGTPYLDVDVFSETGLRGQELVKEIVVDHPGGALIVQAQGLTGTTTIAAAGLYVGTTRALSTPIAAPSRGSASSSPESSTFTETGTWAGRTSGAVAMRYSTETSASATLAFTGTRVELWGKRGPAQGILTVEIDGGAQVAVDCYNPTAVDSALLWLSPTLTVGPHTLLARVAGQQSAGSAGVEVALDLAVIYGTPAATGPAAWLEPFAASSPFKTAIGSGATFAGTGDARHISLMSQGTGDMNCTWYSHPIYRATTADPLASVTDRRGGTVNYRIPSAATAANGSDKHMHVVQPDSSFRYIQEGYNAVKNFTDNWTINHELTDLLGSGINLPNGGTRAYGGSAICGLIRAHELAAGSIKHALALALEGNQMLHGPVWPASAEDGDWATSYTGQLPMGSLVAIPGTTNLATLGLSAAGLILGRAMQDYGAYLVDRSGGPVFYAAPDCDLSTVTAMIAALPTLFPLLRVVTNNTSVTVGGGGTPRQPTQLDPVAA